MCVCCVRDGQKQCKFFAKDAQRMNGRRGIDGDKRSFILKCNEDVDNRGLRGEMRTINFDCLLFCVLVKTQLLLLFFLLLLLLLQWRFCCRGVASCAILWFPFDSEISVFNGVCVCGRVGGISFDLIRGRNANTYGRFQKVSEC